MIHLLIIPVGIALGSYVTYEIMRAKIDKLKADHNARVAHIAGVAYQQGQRTMHRSQAPLTHRLN